MSSSVPNPVDNVVNSARKHPWVSLVSAFTGPAAYLAFKTDNPEFGMLMLSASGPALLAGIVIGGVNALRDRSPLSRTFSAAAAAAGMMAAAGTVFVASQTGLDALVAILVPPFGSTAAGVLNTAAHYINANAQKPPAPTAI